MYTRQQIVSAVQKFVTAEILPTMRKDATIYYIATAAVSFCAANEVLQDKLFSRPYVQAILGRAADKEEYDTDAVLSALEDAMRESSAGPLTLHLPVPAVFGGDDKTLNLNADDIKKLREYLAKA